MPTETDPADGAEVPGDLLRNLIEQVPAVVYVDTNELEPACLYVSPQVADLLGRPAEEWIADRGMWLRAMHPDDRDRVTEAWRRAVRTGEPFREEYRFVRPDGTAVWVDGDARLLRAKDGTPIFWQGVMIDVTDRRRAEDELRASEARYRALVEQVPAIVYEMGPDDERRTLYVSPRVEEILGYSRREWLEQPDIWTELLYPDDREIELAAHDRHSETGEPWIQEYRLIASDGRVVWVRDQAVLVDVEGRRTWQGVMLDVTVHKEADELLRSANDDLELRVMERTAELGDANEMMTLEIDERRRIEAELRETKERYRRLVEDLPAVVYTWQLSGFPETGQVYTSPQIERLTGYTVEEWNSGVWRERIHPHDRDRVLAATARCEVTGEPFELEYRLFARDGRMVWAFDRATLWSRDEEGRPYLYQGVLIDITARKEAEEKAARAEAQYRELAEAGPLMTYVYEVDPEREGAFRVIHMSRRIQELLGYPFEGALSDPDAWIDLVHPDDRAWLQEEIERVWSAGGGWAWDVRAINREGRVLWLHDEGGVVAGDETGRPQRFQGVILDMTEQKEEESRLQASEAAYRSLVEGMPGIPWIEVVDGEPGSGRVTFIGPQVEPILGYTAEELLAEAEHLARMLHPEDRDRVLALSAELDRTGEPWWAEYRVIARDGRTVWLRSVGSPSRDEQGRLVYHGVAHDITEERRAAEDVTVVVDTAPLES
jgi:PAS domain S-box-containing protein